MALTSRNVPKEPDLTSRFTTFAGTSVQVRHGPGPSGHLPKLPKCGSMSRVVTTRS